VVVVVVVTTLRTGVIRARLKKTEPYVVVLTDGARTRDGLWFEDMVSRQRRGDEETTAIRCHHIDTSRYRSHSHTVHTTTLSFYSF
jgi:hypothetical protein